VLWVLRFEALRLLMTVQIETLLTAIEAAFATWPYPGPENLLRDTECGSGACETIRDSIVGKDWRKLNIGDVAYKDNLSLYMTPAGYRYYLPGLMKLSLKNPEIYDLPSYIADALTPPKGGRRREGWLREYKDPFTRDQQDVIRDFLSWVNSRFEGGNDWEPAGRALADGWSS
jgi:hypothetical protein